MIKYIAFGFVIAAIIFAPDDTKKMFNYGVDALHGGYTALSKEIDKQPEFQAGEQYAGKPKTVDEEIDLTKKRKDAAEAAAKAADAKLKALEEQRVKSILDKSTQ